MPRIMLVIFFIIMCTCSRYSNQEIRVVGQVVGYDNKPLPTVFMGISGNGYKEYK